MLTMKAASMVARGARPTALPRVIPKVNMCLSYIWLPFHAGMRKGVIFPCFLMNFVHLPTLLLRLACSDQWLAQRWIRTKTCSSRNGMVCWLSDIVDENVFFLRVFCVSNPSVGCPLLEALTQRIYIPHGCLIIAGRREISEKSFEYNRKTMPALIGTCVIFPIFCYFLCKNELQTSNNTCINGKPKYMWMMLYHTP